MRTKTPSQVAQSEPPTREGYAFTGWYSDPNCQHPFDSENTIVDASATLYARWEPVTESAKGRVLSLCKNIGVFGIAI